MNPNSAEVEYGTTDGKIDYIIDTSGDVDNTGKLVDPPANPDKWVRRVRWYGLPRDTTGDGLITINDVVPLSDVMAYYGQFMSNGKRAVAPWEIDLPNMSAAGDDTPTIKQGLIALNLKDTVALPTARSKEQYWQQNYARRNGGLGPGDAPLFKLTAAFHNQAPPMIRITLKIDDPSGKLRDGQWYQYVLSR
jgi:hypothetical protein